jgi:hypothetical protein
LADAGQRVDIQHLIFRASGPADSSPGIIVIGGHAVGADSLDEVEVGEALADVVDQLLVDGAGGRSWNWSWSWRVVWHGTGSIDEGVSGDARAGERGEVIGGVGRADVAIRSNKEESLSAGASSILVDLILTTNGSRIAISNTVASLEVISDDADTLTENIIVYLIIGTGNGNRCGTCSRSNIVAILRSRSNGAC